MRGNLEKAAVPKYAVLKAVGIVISVFSIYMITLMLAVTALGIDLTVVSNKFMIVNALAYMVGAVLMMVIAWRSVFTFHDFGFRRPVNTRGGLYFWVIAAAHVVYLLVLWLDVGVRSEATPAFLLINFVFTATVGFMEEFLFRGLVFRYLLKFGVYKTILYSAVTFGLLHLVGGVTGVNNLIGTLLQILSAFLFGWAAASLVAVTKSLWSVIIWHFIMNFLSMAFEFSFSSIGGWAFMIANVIFNTAFALWLLPQIKRLYPKASAADNK
jgi:membrane protease YdiL (CAAX protease family)